MTVSCSFCHWGPILFCSLVSPVTGAHRTLLSTGYKLRFWWLHQEGKEDPHWLWPKSFFCSEHLSVADQISLSSKLPKAKEAPNSPQTHLHPVPFNVANHIGCNRLMPHSLSAPSPQLLGFSTCLIHLPLSLLTIIHHQIKTWKLIHQCIPSWNDHL